MTAADTFNALERRDDWLGYGYLGQRLLEADDTLVATADNYALAHAKAHDWTTDDLFAWANSKTGRWYADTMFGGTGPAEDRFDRALREGLLQVPG